MRTLIYIGVILVLIGLGYWLYASYTSGPPMLTPEVDNEVSAQATYFQEQLVSLGVADVGQPIEGFDASMLIMAFPGLVPEDFVGVKTFEGHYEVEENELEFVRDQAQPMTSAAETLSSEGYATLLQNVSARLSLAVETEAEIDELIEQVDTGERVRAGLDETAAALGVTITPLEVLEDSRCPAEVECIQAGTVRLVTSLKSGLGTAEQVFELNQPITTEAEIVTLMLVTPLSVAGEEISPSEYEFTFAITKR